MFRNEFIGLVLLSLVAFGVVGCGDDDDGGSAPADPTVTVNMSVQDWLRQASFDEAQVCVVGTENCTTIADNAFTLEGVSAESSLALMIMGGGAYPTIYPIGTGSEELNGILTLVTGPAAELVIGQILGEEGADETKGAMAFYANSDALSRGVAGANFATEPDLGRPIAFFDNNATSADLTETSFSGNGVTGNVEPGDYVLTTTAPAATCAPWFDARTDRSNPLPHPVMPGHVTFGFVNCIAAEALNVAGQITEFVATGTGEGLEGVSLCTYADAAAAEAGSDSASVCLNTDAGGNYASDEVVAYSRGIVDGVKEGFLVTRFQGETNGFDQPMFNGWLIAPGTVDAVLALHGLEPRDEAAGHVILGVGNEGEAVRGVTITIRDANGDEVENLYFGDDPETELEEFFIATDKTCAGGAEAACEEEELSGAVVFNLAPGTYTWTLDAGVTKTCRNQGGAWGTGTAGVYTFDISAGTLTSQNINCH